eukprot:GHUV01042756.1.p1 GENE.GHUV01042756.1~~GHUV01042756.1.p1  ORF type:complete len:137 (+),score=5.82 GHUV01042756.1:408-818(+)
MYTTATARSNYHDCNLLLILLLRPSAFIPQHGFSVQASVLLDHSIDVRIRDIIERPSGVQTDIQARLFRTITRLATNTCGFSAKHINPVAAGVCDVCGVKPKPRFWQWGFGHPHIICNDVLFNLWSMTTRGGASLC